MAQRIVVLASAVQARDILAAPCCKASNARLNP